MSFIADAAGLSFCAVRVSQIIVTVTLAMFSIACALATTVAPAVLEVGVLVREFVTLCAVATLGFLGLEAGETTSLDSGVVRIDHVLVIVLAHVPRIELTQHAPEVPFGCVLRRGFVELVAMHAMCNLGCLLSADEASPTLGTGVRRIRNERMTELLDVIPIDGALVTTSLTAIDSSVFGGVLMASRAV